MSNERLKQIEAKLQATFNPAELTVIDESHLHAGHAGAKDGKGHFRVTIVADEFADKSMIKCHRLIFSALGNLMETDIHALTIDVSSPQN